MLFVNSGYMFNQHMPGNVLLAFEIKKADSRNQTPHADTPPNQGENP